MGREGNHDVIIPDINCSKYHLKFEYDANRSCYTCIDLGSRNGTLMNGKRMSNAKQESDPMKLLHGTVLQIGQTKLLCHIHDGHSTCGQVTGFNLPKFLDLSTKMTSSSSESLFAPGQCEPGLLGGDNSIDAASSSSGTSKIANVNDDHKRQLKNLKKRYGLQDESK